jgi:cation:H+ antiporter
MLTYILFVLGFVVLIFGAHKLVEGAAGLGFRLGMSQVVVGLTIVALGTSLPELFINIFASIRGNTDLVIGNVLGSNITNTFLIVGAAAMIYAINVSKKTASVMIPASIFAAAVLFVLANDSVFGRENQAISTFDGVILLLFFAAFLYYALFKKDKSDDDNPKLKIKELTVLRSLIYIVAGAVGLYFGGDWIVNGAGKISDDLGVSQSVIGLTLIAGATSLPELVTSIIAAMKKNSAIAIGNAVGSNIFNIFFVLGISATIRPIPFNSTLNFQIGMVVASGFLLLIFVKWTGRKNNLINKIEGALLILAYVLFVVYSVMFQ